MTNLDGLGGRLRGRSNDRYLVRSVIKLRDALEGTHERHMRDHMLSRLLRTVVWSEIVGMCRR